MRFDLVDQILERSADRIVTRKSVTAAEEYLADHFPGYPVLPGVLMLEAMVQAARRYLADGGGPGPWVVGEVRQVRYGAFVRPGESLRLTVDLVRQDGAHWRFKGTGDVDGRTAVQGRFVLRPPVSEAPDGA